MALASDTAYAALKDQIQRGDIAPGEMIDEAESARKLGISRTPVREALLRLQSEGFIEIGRGKGIRVHAAVERGSARDVPGDLRPRSLGRFAARA